MIKIILTACFFCLGLSASAQTILTYAQGDQYAIMIVEDQHGRKFLRYQGDFVNHSGTVISNYIVNFPDIEYVEFNSTGGVLLEVHKPGVLLRNREIPFHVREGEVCISACAFLALYSQDIKLDGLLAFHLPYIEEFRREETLYDISQSMVERTLRMTRQFYQNDWMAILYLVIAQKSDLTTYVVFDDVDELMKFKITNKDQFMSRPDSSFIIHQMTVQDLQHYITTSRR